jgi:hypothetical protein
MSDDAGADPDVAGLIDSARAWFRRHETVGHEPGFLAGAMSVVLGEFLGRATPPQFLEGSLKELHNGVDLGAQRGKLLAMLAAPVGNA